MQSFTSIGPMLDLIAVFPLVALFAGKEFPYAIIISFLISFTTTNTTYQLSRKFSTNGGYYSYTGKVMGKTPGFFVALNYLAYSVIVMLAIASFAGYFIYVSLYDFGDVSSTVIPLIFSVVFTSIVFGIVFLGLRKSLGFTILAGTAEAVFIIIMSTFMFLNPASQTSIILVPLSPNDGFFTGVIFGILAFSGSGSSIFLSEDSREPKKTPAKGLALSFLISGLIMIISSFAVVSFLGNYLTQYVVNPASLLLTIQQKFGLLVLLPAAAFLVLSAMNLSVSYLNALLRSTRKMFFDHILYRKDSTKGNNAFLIILVAVVSLTMALALIFGSYAAFVYMSSLAGLFFITVHAFSNVALIKLKGRIITSRILPVVSLIFLITVFVVSLMSFALEFPDIIYTYAAVILLIFISIWQAFTSKQFYNEVEFHVS